MRLMYVTDNGFSRNGGRFYYSAPNMTHVKHLSKYFDEFIFVAREDRYDESNSEIRERSTVSLVKKYSIFKLLKTLREQLEHADAVICYGINGFFASIVAKLMKKQVIVYSGGDVYDNLRCRGTLLSRVLAPILRTLERIKFKIADYAHYCDDFLIERYPTNGKILVASGVQIEVDDEIIENRLNRIAESFRNNTKIIGLIGYTSNNLKGIDIAIQAIGQLGPDYVLQIVGRGNHQHFDDLAEKLGVRSNVHFLGTLKAGREIFAWLDNIDVYIQPSRSEGLPRATIEAMSRGCPVVSSNAGGLRKLIDDRFRIENDDYVQLASKIKMLTLDHESMIEQASNNFEKAMEYSPTNRERKYDSFYGEIVKKLIVN